MVGCLGGGNSRFKFLMCYEARNAKLLNFWNWGAGGKLAEILREILKSTSVTLNEKTEKSPPPNALPNFQFSIEMLGRNPIILNTCFQAFRSLHENCSYLQKVRSTGLAFEFRPRFKLQKSPFHCVCEMEMQPEYLVIARKKLNKKYYGQRTSWISTDYTQEPGPNTSQM